MIEEM
jgi:hypothetical protein